MAVPVAILAVLLLSLALVALSARPAAKRTGWVRALRIVVLVALTAANGLFLLRRGAQAPQSTFDPFSIATACFLIGWFILHDYERAARAEAVSPPDGGVGEREPSLLRPLAESAEALAVGAVAGTLTLLSVSLAGAIGLAGSSAGLYPMCALSGLFALVTLPRPTLFHVGLAAAAWLSIARGIAAAASTDALLPVMLALFMLFGWLGGILGRARRHP